MYSPSSLPRGGRLLASVTGAGAGDPRPVPRTRRAHLQLLPRREVAGVSTTNPSVVASPLLAGTLLRLCPNPGSSPGLGDRLGGGQLSSAQEGEVGRTLGSPSYSSVACFVPCAVNHWGAGLRLPCGPGGELGLSYPPPTKAHLRLNLLLHFPIHS